MQACAVVGCEVTAGRIIAGYCSIHYQRMKKHGDPGPPGRQRDWNADKACSIDGCPRSSLRRGMCQLHYQRVQTYGDPHFIKLGHDVSLTPREEASCLNCSATLAGKRSNAVYCSRACKMAAAERRRSRFRPERPSSPPRSHPVAEGVTRDACLQCGSAITGRGPSARYCSSSCAYRRRYELNAEKMKEQARSTYWADPDKHRLYSRNYRGANREKRGIQAARRAERMRSGRTQIAKRDWDRLVNRFDGRCAYCGFRTDSLQMDHVVPLARGGRHSLGNILPACGPCNVSKRAHFLTEWRRRP